MLVYWSKLNREKFKVLKDSTVVLPIGAMEQHGPHLPVMTDTALLKKIVIEGMESASSQIPMILAPTIPFGFSHHHFLFPGALSLNIETLLNVLSDLLESIVRSGFKKIFILNSHGGNDEVIKLAARKVALQYDVKIGASSYWTIAADVLKNYKEKTLLKGIPGHAGQFETSMMMAIHPELVHLEKLADQEGERESLEMDLLQERPKLEQAWIWKTINGFSDSPKCASEKIGKDLLDLITKELAKFLVDFHQKNY